MSCRRAIAQSVLVKSYALFLSGYVVVVQILLDNPGFPDTLAYPKSLSLIIILISDGIVARFWRCGLRGTGSGPGLLCMMHIPATY